MRHAPLNALDSKLKRQLTGGVVQSEIQHAEAVEKNILPDKYKEQKMMMAARRKELQEQAEDEEDSRTRNINSGSAKKAGLSAPTTTTAKHNRTEATTISRSEASTSLSKSSAQPIKANNQKIKYQASVHPAALKAAPSDHVLESSGLASKAGQGAGKKRPTDFFSLYMDERANKMAKKKTKNSAKRDPDDD